MRYRRLSYRYVFLTSGQPRPLAYLPQADRSLGLAQLSWRPAADIYETPDRVVVSVELAGVDESEIELQLFEDALVLEGRRRLPRPAPDAVYLAAEVRQGPYRLEIALPGGIDQERVEATYERGVLQVVLMKAGAGSV